MQKNKILPTALFDQEEYLNKTSLNDAFVKNNNSPNIQQQFEICKEFLLMYRGSPDTFKSYRREIEKLCQWSWLIEKKSILELTRNDILNYIDFSNKPPINWIATKSCPRFIIKDGERVQNNKWRPFLVRNSKIDAKNNIKLASAKQYKTSPASLRALFAGLGTFYTYLQQEQLIQFHPVHSIRQKSKFFLSKQNHRISRTLSTQQWQIIIKTILKMSKTDPLFQRHVFILSVFYLLGLRISELVPSHRHTPTMADFYKDHNNSWWFVTIGKGNKEREIAVPDIMLAALINYRQFLNLPTKLPTRGEATPLLPKQKGYGSIGIRQLRNIIQTCFDISVEQLKQNQQIEMADELSAATAHWLRHTAISHDVQNRPKEHVRDDAGHHNTSVTDLYIDIDRADRHASARDKKLIPE